MANILFAANLTKGFEALSIHDYFKAKKIFEKGLKNQTPASAYGLSIIYSLNNNPFYNLDSALFYINKSEESFKVLPEKTKAKLLIYNIDSLSIYNQHTLIDERAFIVANKLNTVESYTYFISTNNNALQLDEAKSLRNQLAFNQAEQINLSSAYLDFMTTYPDADEFAEAKTKYEKRLFDEYTEINTLDNNLKFINEHPSNPYVNQAHQNIYDISTHNKTIVAYHNFIKTFPENPLVSTAWRMLYNLSTLVHTPENIQKFVELWRKHFIMTTNPKHMPIGWDIYRKIKS